MPFIEKTSFFPRLLHWSKAASFIGPVLVAWTDAEAVALVAFAGEDKTAGLLDAWQHRAPHTLFKKQSLPPQALADALRTEDLRAPLLLCGSAFQHQVWLALRAIPRGKTMSYGAVAAALGKPKAARAVGQACGANPVPLFVPCHRVIASSGKIGGFSGPLTVKEALLKRENPESSSRDWRLFS